MFFLIIFMQIVHVYKISFFFPFRFSMMEPYAGNLSSTGEPPTESSSDISTSAQNIMSSGNDTLQEATLYLNSSRSLSVQEPDSGYEASPSSIAEGHNQRFFGEQSASRQAEIRQVNSDEELSGEFTGFHFSESESELDDYDTCDCSSSPCSCFRTDSSTTNFTAISNCDNSRCNSSELSYSRNSSQPIQIPNLPSFRFSSDASCRSIDVNPVPCTPLTRSFPMDFSPRLGLDLISEHVNLSWPSFASPLTNYNCRRVALSISRSNPSNTNIPQNRHNFQQHPARSRRIDSEGSSINSSEDEEGPEDDVFSKFF